MKKQLLFHPFLFALFPIISLYVHNIDQLRFPVIFQPVFIALIVTFFILLTLGRLLGDHRKAALVVSLLLVMFFSYGHFYKAAERWAAPGGHLDGHTVTLASWAALFIFLAWLVNRMSRGLKPLTGVLNMTAVFLVAMPVAGGVHWWAAGQENAYVRERIDGGTEYKIGGRPDIYYIILDSYGRTDILSDLYRYDNGEFISYLEGKGFYVADQSYANYIQTYLSLASSLNITYLDDLAAHTGSDSTDKSPLIDMITANDASAFLKKRGYKIIALTSGWAGTEDMNADLSPEPKLSLSEFESILLNNTPLFGVLRGSPGTSENYMHKRRILYIFEKLSEIAGDDQPTFTFAHILSPHTPFVFGNDGSGPSPYDISAIGDVGTRVRRRKQNSYINQLAYINGRLRETIDTVLAVSSTEPVIILQADHGPHWGIVPDRIRMKERMAILNAYYLPDGSGREGGKPYSDITPVNTFRLVFNRYFGTDYEMLQDRSYYSAYEKPYRLWNVTRQIRGRQGRKKNRS